MRRGSLKRRPLAVVTVHVESHPKFRDPSLGQTAFLRFIEQNDFPPLSLHWLRDKDDPRDFRHTLRSIDPRHEVALHFHSMMDFPVESERRRRLGKEKRLLEALLGNTVRVFSSGHFGMNAEAPGDLASIGLEIDCSVTPGMVMVSPKSSHCSYQADLPDLFWWDSGNGHRILEIPVTTSSEGSLLDAAVIPLRETLAMVRSCLDTRMILHLTAHSYHFLLPDLRPGHGATVHRNLFSLLSDAGFLVVTPGSLVNYVDLDALPVMRSEQIIRTGRKPI